MDQDSPPPASPPAAYPEEATAPHLPLQRMPAESGAPRDVGDGDRSGPRVGLIVGAVLVAATLLVLVTLGATFLLSRLDLPFNSSEAVTYEVGDCVVQEGSVAPVAECDAPGAFRIVSQVDTRDDCPDPTQPAIEVPGPPAEIYCLEQVEGAQGEESTDGS